MSVGRVGGNAYSTPIATAATPSVATRALRRPKRRASAVLSATTRNDSTARIA
jgi:hypothetical protein